MDARHAEVLHEGTHPSEVASARSHLRHALPVCGELRDGFLARRSGPRQSLNAFQNGRVAHPGEGGESPRTLHAHVGISWKEAALHGLGIRAIARVELRRSLDW